MAKEFKLGSHTIGPNHPPFIVAELSGNHNGSIDKALKLIEQAKEAGVHAVKFQTYTPDTITLNIREGAFLVDDPSSLWKGRNLYDLYIEAHTPWEWHEILFEKARDLGLVAFSTPFDETAVDFLETLNVPCYKIGALEIIDLPLIKKVAATKKPLILSVGATNFKEVEEAVFAAREAGCEDLVLLKCPKAYPADPAHFNLRTLPHMAETFDVLVGISDHTLSLGVPLASIAFGCCWIEKHFTGARAEGGVDSAFSSEPREFKFLVEESKIVWEALGRVQYDVLPSEELERMFRPSLYFVEEVKAGTIVKPHHIRSVRPAGGLLPKEIDKIVGSKLKRDVKYGTPVSWDLFG